MSTVDVLKLPGDYKIQTVSSGEIRLDTGNNTGTVVITGSLKVEGPTTYVTGTNTVIQDNELVLNKDGYSPQTHYINGGTSGIRIDRGGNIYDARLYFDDSLANGSWIDPTNGSHRGIWRFKSDNAASIISVSGIRLDTQNIDVNVNGTPRLTLIGNDSANTNAVVSVKGTVNYEENVTDDDDIPNKAYVDNKFANTQIEEAEYAHVLIGVTPAGVHSNSFITITDQGEAATGKISFFIDDYLTAEISPNSVQLANLSISETTIQPFFTGTNIYLVTTNGAEVVVNSALTYQVPSAPPEPSANQVKVYSTSTTGAGGTGLMFVNSDNRDELVSSRKMMIYSIIF